MRTALFLVSGILFGLGLCISQMVNPAKVLGFLDIAGTWDPSLAFVMLAAVGVCLAGFPLTKSMLSKPVLEGVFPKRSELPIDKKLILGAAIFGIGWGTVGLCPGPALASLAYGTPKSYLFVVCMLIGMLTAKYLLHTRLSNQ